MKLVMLIILRTYKNRPQFTTPAHKHTLVAEGQDDLDHVLLPNNKVMTMHSQEQRPKVCVCVWLTAEQDGQNVAGKAESPVERCQAWTQVKSGPGSILISSALSAAHTP